MVGAGVGTAAACTPPGRWPMNGGQRYHPRHLGCVHLCPRLLVWQPFVFPATCDAAIRVPGCLCSSHSCPRLLVWQPFVFPATCDAAIRVPSCLCGSHLCSPGCMCSHLALGVPIVYLHDGQFRHDREVGAQVLHQTFVCEVLEVRRKRGHDHQRVGGLCSSRIKGIGIARITRARPSVKKCDCQQGQGTRCSVQGTRYRVQGTRYRVQGTRCRVQCTRYRVQSTVYKVQSTGYKVQSTGYKVRSTGYRAQERRLGSGLRVGWSGWGSARYGQATGPPFRVEGLWCGQSYRPPYRVGPAVWASHRSCV